MGNLLVLVYLEKRLLSGDSTSSSSNSSSSHSACAASLYTVLSIKWSVSQFF